MLRVVLFAAICLSLAATQDGSEGHRIPLKMKRSSGYNKHSQYANRERNQQPQRSMLKQVKDFIWGKDEKTLRFEQALAEIRGESSVQNPKWKKKLGSSKFRTELTMNEGFMFHGPVYMGTSQEYFDVVYDTGSDWLVLDGKTCRNCQGNVYDTATSTRSKNLGNPVSVRAYGSAILYGTEYSDLVCLNEFQGCVNNFEYFLITANQTGLREPFDGIVGLSRNIQPILAPEGTEMEIGPILPDFLAKAGVISDNRFSFCYQYDGIYFVDFGPPQNDAMDAVEDLRDIPMLDDFYWSQWMQGIAFGDTSEANAYAFAGELYSIFDTGTSVMLLSSDYFESIVVKYMNDYVGSDQYAIQQGAVYSECFDTTEMPGMYFLFNNTWIELLPDDFMIDVSEAQDRSICMLMFIENSYPFNLFGSPLFMGYYSIHDTANDKISWAPSVGSYKSVLTSGKVPKQQLKPKMPMSTEEIINTITISVIVGIGYLYLTYAHPWVSSRTGEIISIIIGVAVCGSLIAVYYFVGLPILRTLFGVQRDPEEVTPDKLPNPSEGGSAMMRSSSFMRVAATGGAIIFLAKLAFKPKKVASAAPNDDVATNTLL